MSLTLFTISPAASQFCLAVELKALVPLRQLSAAIEKFNDVLGVAVVKGTLRMDYIVEAEFTSGGADDVFIAASLPCDLILQHCAFRVEGKGAPVDSPRMVVAGGL